jgi:hypothetical protein
VEKEIHERAECYKSAADATTIGALLISPDNSLQDDS